MKKLEHLAEVYNAYDTFIIDLWGVMHNGIKLNNEAINVVDNLTKNNKKVIFLSNAPRPNKNVIKFLRKLDMEEKYLKNVLTSGEAAINSLRNKKFGDRFFHLGPERDASLFDGFKEKKTNIEKHFNIRSLWITNFLFLRKCFLSIFLTTFYTNPFSFYLKTCFQYQTNDLGGLVYHLF